ncbi:hypothetical protein F8M41_003669 [Gigaspora margarita]|uniref:Uncharacterized protein n=1 Tax=Gigaspora margarita TaxID=4874 RepID=A0A8H3XAZ9_GIGMA|nr:hypothetical protein F8M41_003669 [Gigaspora margarita]
MLFGSTVHDSDPVGRFYSKLRKLARLAGIDEQQIRLQFIHGISSDNQLEIRCIGINRAVSELLTELEEIERYKTEQLSGAYLYLGLASLNKSHRKDNYLSNMGITRTEIENLIKSMILSIQSQSISLQPSQSHYRSQLSRTSQIDPNTEAIRQFVEIMKRAKKTLDKEPGPTKKKADKIHIDRFLDEVLENMGDDPDPSGFHDNVDPVEDIRRQMGDLYINQTKIAKAIKKISSKSKSSHCKTKSKSRTKKKKSSKRINAHIISDESSSDSSDSENSMTSSENKLETNTLACLESDFSETSSESSSSESDLEEYEINATKKNKFF